MDGSNSLTCEESTKVPPAPPSSKSNYDIRVFVTKSRKAVVGRIRTVANPKKRKSSTSPSQQMKLSLKQQRILETVSDQERSDYEAEGYETTHEEELDDPET